MTLDPTTALSELLHSLRPKSQSAVLKTFDSLFPSGRGTISLNALAEAANVSKKTLVDALNGLKAIGLLNYEVATDGGRGNAKSYQIAELSCIAVLHQAAITSRRKQFDIRDHRLLRVPLDSGTVKRWLLHGDEALLHLANNRACDELPHLTRSWQASDGSPLPRFELESFQVAGWIGWRLAVLQESLRRPVVYPDLNLLNERSEDLCGRLGIDEVVQTFQYLLALKNWPRICEVAESNHLADVRIVAPTEEVICHPQMLGLPKRMLDA